MDQRNMLDLHVELMLTLQRTLTSSMIRDITCSMLPWDFYPGELERMQDFFDIWQSLEIRCRVRPNDYGVLKDMLSRTGHMEAVNIIEDTEKRFSDLKEAGDSQAQQIPQEARETSEELLIKLKNAEKVVKDDDEVYKMVQNPRGLALIISNKHFMKSTRLADRSGTEVDVQNMKTLLEQLFYKVIVKTDRTAKQMTDDLIEYQKNEDHNKYESMILVILSHGGNGFIYGTDGEFVELSDISAMYMYDAQNCSALKGKPKIFIIQACRGKKIDPGVEDTDSKCQSRAESVDEDGETSVNAKSLKKIASTRDMFFAFSSLIGYVSHRNTKKGSWFVQAIVKTFVRLAHREDLDSLFTAVNRCLTEDLQIPDKVPMPMKQSTLTRKLYFNTGYSACE